MTLPRSRGPVAPTASTVSRMRATISSSLSWGGQVLFQHGQLGGFLVRQLGAPAVAERLDALAAVVGLLRHDFNHRLVVQRFPALLLHGLHREL